MPYLDELAILGDWLPFPCEWLHGFPNDTIFLLRRGVTVHVCVSIGNSPDDREWKYQRLSDFKLRRLSSIKNRHDCKALVLYAPVKNQQNPE